MKIKSRKAENQAFAEFMYVSQKSTTYIYIYMVPGYVAKYIFPLTKLSMQHDLYEQLSASSVTL